MDNNSPVCSKCGHDCCWGQEFDGEQEYQVCGHCGNRVKVIILGEESLIKPCKMASEALKILHNNLNFIKTSEVDSSIMDGKIGKIE